MPFKIVQTIERGKTLLTPVPNNWEQDGILYWPKKITEKLQHDENSVPQQQWSTKNCFLKRDKILSIERAQSIIDQMCDQSDTENEQDISRFSRHAKPSNITQSDFNDMAEGSSKNRRVLMTDGTIEQTTCAEVSDSQNSISVNQDEQQEVVTVPFCYEPQNSILLQQLEDPRLTNVLPKIDEISKDIKSVLDSLKDNFATIFENQQIIFQTQSNLVSKISEMHTQLEELVKRSFKSTEEIQSSDFKPISSLKEFKDLEDLLSNPDLETTKELKKKLSVVCSKGKGKGMNNAYVLIDVLFERDFLTNCSWAGGSKSDKMKICFKSFVNTIKLFFTIIHESDENFSLVDCHKFLKIVLRNSLQRTKNQRLRSSSQKNRPKKKITLQSEPKESPENQCPDQLQPVTMVVNKENITPDRSVPTPEKE